MLRGDSMRFWNRPSFSIMANASNFYAELSGLLAQAGVAPDSAELHGGICGSLCAGGVGASQAWISDWLSPTDALDLDARHVLAELEQQTWQSLASPDLLLEPLLPSDDESISARVEALAGWCHGFLGGLGVAALAVRSEGSTTVEISEIVNDFAELSKAGIEGEADPIAAEFQLAEIIEYVRISVQIVFESLAPARDAGVPKSIH